MIKNYFVTGGTGFIGSAIVDRLSKLKKSKIIVFDNNSRISRKNKKKIHKNVIYINGDIRNRLKLNLALKKYKINTIIHLAYINGTKFFYNRPCEIIEVAARGMQNIIELGIKYKIPNFFLASSSEVYHEPKIIPTPENIDLKVPNIFNPRFSYGGGKIFCELMAANYGRKYFKKMIIFRPHNVYGPNMGNEHVVPEFINNLKNKKNKNAKFKIKGSGKEKRSFIYIDDFADAFMTILKKGNHLNVYNIGNDSMISIKSLADKISKIMGFKPVYKYVSIAKGGTKFRCPNIKKIKKIGYKKKINLSEGLTKTIKWYVNEK